MNIYLKGVFQRLSFCFVLIALLAACQQANLPNPNITQIDDKVEIPIGDISPDVLPGLQTTRLDNPSIGEATRLNLIANPDFESGTSSWVACDTGSTLASTNDSVSGLALSVTTGCMYQDVIVQPNKEYTLTCKAKLNNTTGWSGIGYGFMDSSFATLVQGPDVQITGTAWSDYSSSFVSPANSNYVAIWAYTDGSITLDDCSFSTITEAVPDPDPETLLQNGSFDTQSDWSNCGNAAAYSIASGNLTTNATSCIYQTIEANAGADYHLSCDSKADAGVYATISLSMLNSAWAPIATDSIVVNSSTFDTFDLAKVAPPETTYVAVTLYNEGATTHEACYLTINTMAKAVPLPNGSLFSYPSSHPESGQVDNEVLLASGNLLINPSFTTQAGWTNCAAANATIANGQLNTAPGTCLYQQIDAEVGKSYTLTCKGNMDLPAYSVFTLNMVDVNYQNLDTKVQSLTTTSNEWTLTSVAPANTKYVTIGFYTETAAVYDYCYLSTETPQVENETIHTPNNLLVNPSFTTQAGWTNCAATSATIADGQLNATPGVCFFQQLNAEVGKTYSLTCKGSMDLPLYSVFTLNMLDVGYQSLATTTQTLNTTSRQWRLSLEAPANSTYITVGFYTETPAIYDYCYLSSEPPAPLADEIVYEPVKPLELLVPIYIDPAQDLTPWNQILATAQTIPTTVVVNPVIGDIEGCQESTFKTMLGNLQTNNVDTVGYIPTGYTATPPAIVKERIDRFKNCVGIDGVFFDEIKVSNQAEANYYDDICNYAKNAFGPGKFVVNAGTNIQIPITNEYCNIALIYEFYDTNWQDFAVFGYQGANTDPATSIMIHTSNGIDAMKNSVDLAYSRKIDYIYVTDETVPNPWIKLGSYWTEFINYMAQKNASFN